MIKLLMAILKDQTGGTLAITRKTANTLITAAGFNTNFSEIEAILNGDVDSTNIEDAAVTAAKLASDAVTTAKILDANVTAAKLASDAVTTVKITDANVTAAKLASDAVETAKIKDDAVTTAKILDANVTTAKIADSNITTAKINFDHGNLGGLTDHDHALYVRGQGNNYKIDSGTVSLPGSSDTAITFNFAFASAPVLITSIEFSASNLGYPIRTKAVTTTGATVYQHNGSTVTCHWIAIGTPA